MDSLRCIVVPGMCAAISSAATADLPLTVEDLITDKGKIRIDASLSHANSDRQNLLTDSPIVIQTSDTSFITLPTRFGELKGNTDVLGATLGVRYGLTRYAEVYTRATYLYRSTRFSDLSETRVNRPGFRGGHLV